MAARGVLAALCGLLLSSCVGLYGPKGNDIGGVIPWNPENESNMMLMAQANCDPYRKYVVFTGIHRTYGDFITYDCRFGPPLQRSVPPTGAYRAYTEAPLPAGGSAPKRAHNAPSSIAGDEPVVIR